MWKTHVPNKFVQMFIFCLYRDEPLFKPDDATYGDHIYKYVFSFVLYMWDKLFVKFTIVWLRIKAEMQNYSIRKRWNLQIKMWIFSTKCVIRASNSWKLKGFLLRLKCDFYVSHSMRSVLFSCIQFLCKCTRERERGWLAGWLLCVWYRKPQVFGDLCRNSTLWVGRP